MQTEARAEFLKVAFPIPLAEAYWYRNLSEAPARTGCRVEASLGRRMLIGFAIQEASACPIDEALLKPIKRRIDEEPLFGEDVVGLADWMSKMYFCSLGEALGAMLPSGKRESAQPSFEMEDFRIGDHALPLTDEQAAALEGIRSRPAGTTYLYGPTGTGKTEVFLQEAERVLAEGSSVIYLVPEIALTAQVVRAARKRFGSACAVIHSRLTPSQKLAEWRRILSGEARMVIGARSAVFAPVLKLGLIVIDEEHEGSYKSGSTPRYHARQVAMRRASASGARLILGSATPSVEAWHACAEGNMRKETLTKRPAGGAFPKVEIVDMRQEAGALSSKLKEALAATKAEGRQSILFLNRRGFSHFFQCATCGAELTCRHCSVSLTYHKEQNQLVCHYCGYRTSPPDACPECGSLDVGWKGFGTERVEEELRAAFPDFRIERLDADTVTRRESLGEILEAFADRRVDLLIGTQMVAKGLNFPGVKTVGVVLADAGLNLPDFRASERVFSLIVQVAGRAGRCDPDGKVYVQTLRPDNPVIRMAAAMDMDGFYAGELENRKMQGFPPFGRIARIVVRSKDRDACIGTVRDIARRFSPPPGRGAPRPGGLARADAELYGPAECPLGMIAGSYRWQILIRADSLLAIRESVANLVSGYKLPSKAHLEIDVDPVQLL